MKFSIITPAKPSELPQLLALKRNLLHQIATNFEWIISIDLDLNILDHKWQASFPIRAVRPATPTIAGARNAAMSIAQGDWLVFLDSDDYLLPTSLAYLDGTQALSPSTMADLNQYPTYEPHVSFANSMVQ